MTSILTERITTFAEEHNLIPKWQFGFRKKRSTVGAATLLNEILKTRLNNKKRTFVCFVDLPNVLTLLDETYSL